MAVIRQALRRRARSRGGAAWHFRSLSTRLMLVMLGFCLVFAICAVALRTWSAWNSGVAEMSSDLLLVEQAFQPILGRAAQDRDRALLNAHVEALASAAPIGKATLTLAQRGQPADTITAVHAGWRPSSWAPVRQVVLHAPTGPDPNDPGETIGTLTLYGDERMLWRRMNDEVLGIGLTQLVQAVLLAGLTMLVCNRLVTHHVRRIARHLAALNPSNLHQPLRLERVDCDDELTLLVGGVNQLQGNLSDYLQRQQRYENELADHRDHLAEMIQARTRELQAANVQLEALSRTDALTGLANRRHFDAVTQSEFLRAQRTGQPLCLLLCDIDFFKRYNDRYGHAAGDACLRAVAHAMRDGLGRAGDLLARIGGEEFAVLLPATAEAQACALAERLCRTTEALRIDHAASEGAAHVTLSIGVAQLDAKLDGGFDALFRHADQALYLAKGRGRNQVATYRAAA
ncbi:MAG: diguanylate cyclase [Xylophilus ampelinus]